MSMLPDGAAVLLPAVATLDDDGLVAAGDDGLAAVSESEGVGVAGFWITD